MKENIAMLSASCKDIPHLSANHHEASKLAIHNNAKVSNPFLPEEFD